MVNDYAAEVPGVVGLEVLLDSGLDDVILENSIVCKISIYRSMKSEMVHNRDKP